MFKVPSSSDLLLQWRYLLEEVKTQLNVRVDWALKAGMLTMAVVFHNLNIFSSDFYSDNTVISEIMKENLKGDAENCPILTRVGSSTGKRMIFFSVSFLISLLVFSYDFGPLFIVCLIFFVDVIFS